MPIDLGLLGCTHPAADDALAVIVSEPDLRLAAAWDSDPARIPGPISAYAVADAEVAIARADAVVVCAPVDERPGLCARAALAGRPVLVQPPVAPTAAAAQRLAREVVRHRTPVLPALYLRELPALARLRATVRAGVLGRLSGVDAGLAADRTVDERGRNGGARREGRQPRFAHVAIHLLDAVAFLGEVPRLDAVSLDHAAGGSDLGGAALGRWAGVPLVLRARSARHGPEVDLAIDGDRVRAVISDGRLELQAGGGQPEYWIGAPPDPGEAVRAFANRLRRRAFPPDGLTGVVRAQAIAERASRLD